METGRRPEPPDPRDKPVSASACPEPRGLVSVGERGDRSGAPRGPADLPLDRLLRLPLVPRDGSRVVRESRDRRTHERPLRQHQGRPGGASRPRPDLHDGRPDDHRQRRMADERLPHPGSEALPRRDLFSSGGSRAMRPVSRGSCAPWPRYTGPGARTWRGPPRRSRRRSGVWPRLPAPIFFSVRDCSMPRPLESPPRTIRSMADSGARRSSLRARRCAFCYGSTERTERIDFLGIARSSLDAMAAGGIYDHLGGGFHRYSTDERWLVPHFEKMLYDQALLSIAYLEAFQVTDDPAYARVARETLDYVLREMTAPEGGFYSSEDADDAGGEGFFYTWTLAEVRAVLDEGDAGLLSRVYDVDEVGSFDGRSVLHRLKSNAEAAAILGGSDDEMDRRMDAARSKLLDARARRPRPARDGKVLADWNGLAILGLCPRVAGSLGTALPRRGREGGRLPSCPTCVDEQGRLLHVWTDGAANIPGFLADHACLLAALIDLYEASGDARRLAEASRIAAAMIREFWDEEGGAFCDTGPRHGDLIARTRHAEDASTVSGNGMAAFGLIRLARITSDAGLLSYAERTLRDLCARDGGDPLGDRPAPSGSGSLPRRPPGNRAGRFRAMRPKRARCAESPIDSSFRTPSCCTRTVQEPPWLAGLRGKVPVDGRPAAYVCSDFTCRAPVTTPEDLAKASEAVATVGSSPARGASQRRASPIVKTRVPLRERVARSRAAAGQFDGFGGGGGAALPSPRPPSMTRRPASSKSSRTSRSASPVRRRIPERCSHSVP